MTQTDTATSMTRETLKKEINAIAAEYCGTPMNIVKSRWSRAVLENVLEHSQHMISLKRRARSIEQKYTKEAWLALVLEPSGQAGISDLAKHEEYSRQADSLWYTIGRELAGIRSDQDS